MQNEDIKEQVYKIGYDIQTGKITAIFTEDPMLYAIESWIPVPENFDVHEINRPGAGMENQKDELSSWYRAWLDVTITLTPPAKPLWLK